MTIDGTDSDGVGTDGRRDAAVPGTHWGWNAGPVASHRGRGRLRGVTEHRHLN
ncbi:hypothetical protein NKG94_13305 [Micromonospora sp. M12]